MKKVSSVLCDQRSTSIRYSYVACTPFVNTGSPYDWLFSFEDVSDIMEFLIPDKNGKILMIGSGNAPFSPDM